MPKKRLDGALVLETLLYLKKGHMNSADYLNANNDVIVSG